MLLPCIQTGTDWRWASVVGSMRHSVWSFQFATQTPFGATVIPRGPWPTLSVASICAGWLGRSVPVAVGVEPDRDAIPATDAIRTMRARLPRRTVGPCRHDGFVDVRPAGGSHPGMTTRDGLPPGRPGCPSD